MAQLDPGSALVGLGLLVVLRAPGDPVFDMLKVNRIHGSTVEGH